MVAETYVRTEGAFPLIGVGGIDSGGAALTKIRAGASLISSIRRWSTRAGLVDDIKNTIWLDLAAPGGTRCPNRRRMLRPLRRGRPV